MPLDYSLLNTSKPQKNFSPLLNAMFFGSSRTTTERQITLQKISSLANQSSAIVL